MTCSAAFLGADAGSEDLHMRSILLDATTAAVIAIAGAVIALAHCWYRVGMALRRWPGASTRVRGGPFTVAW